MRGGDTMTTKQIRFGILGYQHFVPDGTRRDINQFSALTVAGRIAFSSIKKTIHVLLRIEDHEIVQLLADARVANWKS